MNFFHLYSVVAKALTEIADVYENNIIEGV